MKVLLVVGTRPEAIKLAPLYFALCGQAGCQVRLCSTGQHREMLDQVLKLFNLRPNYDLDLMAPDQNLFDFTASSLKAMRVVLDRERPDVVVVQGDTVTAFTAGLASYYLKLPLAHVEAGLRTGDPWAPFPEELYRKMCDALSTFHFAPTLWAKNNLLREGYPEARLYVTGNTVVDALLMIWHQVKALERPPGVPEQMASDIQEWIKETPRMVLVTGHRRESFGEGMKNIAIALKGLATQHDDINIIYPVHMNPNVQKPVRAILEGVPRVHLLPPVPYDAFVWLMGKCSFVMTDSGGVQEEAPSLGKPVLVMRTKTERPEAVEAGTARLVGNSCEGIMAAAQTLLLDHAEYSKISTRPNPFGDGRASERIAAILSGELDK